MSQYRTGTVSITQGSTAVTGTGTLWNSVGIQEGDLFNIQGANGWYYVAAVQSNTALTLTAPYTGSSVYSESYVIHRDFLTTYSIPLMQQGSTNWPSIYNEAMRRINMLFGGDAEGSGTGLDLAYDVENVVAVDDAAIKLNRDGEHSTEGPTALVIRDLNTLGQTGTDVPVEKSLCYMYSYANPTLTVMHNNNTQNTTPRCAILAAAMGTDHTLWESIRGCKNTAIVALSVDQDDTYGTDHQTNIAVKAHSQRGYAIYASTNREAALKIAQPADAPAAQLSTSNGIGLSISTITGRPFTISTYGADYGQYIVNSNAGGVGTYIKAEKPLELYNNTFSTLQPALLIMAQQRGATITGTTTPTDTYPLVKITAPGGGTALQTTGYVTVNNYNNGRGLYVRAGQITVSENLPAVKIESAGCGVDITSSSGTDSYAVKATAVNTPAIYAYGGIVPIRDNYNNITLANIGTLVYSTEHDSLMLNGASGWRTINDSEQRCVCETGITLYHADVTTLPVEDRYPGLVIYHAVNESLNIFDNSLTAHRLVEVDKYHNYQTRCICLYIPNVLTVENNIISFVLPFTGQITAATAQVDVAPLGGDIILRVYKGTGSGTLICTLTISDGETVVTGNINSTDFITANSPLPIGTKVWVNCTSIGVTQSGGQDTRITLVIKQTEMYELE